MDRTSKILINALRKSAGNQGTNCVFCPVDEHGKLNYYTIAWEYNLSKSECNSSIEHLKKIGLLIPRTYINPISKNEIEYGVSLSHEAVNLDEFKRISFKKYLLNNWIAIIALIFSLISLVRSFM
ncbi:MAG: hypothetical protein DBX37_05810 [Massilioclostridium sp.]|nr:MAG: hypothetical protein DBX37_05810 [Massilioclostridium sp.]